MRLVGGQSDRKQRETDTGAFFTAVWGSSASTGTSNLKLLARFRLLNWEEQFYEGNVGVTASSPHSKANWRTVGRDTT